MANRPSQYNAVAIFLHWTIATAILVTLALGQWMHGAIEDADTQATAVTAFQLHKSLGLSILVLSLIRLIWRLSHARPALPETMLNWERRAASLTHWVFYFLMIALPLSGWLYVSTQWRGDMPLNVPTLWFGLFEVPHLFGLNTASEALRAQLAAASFGVHETLAGAVLALLVLHVAAALRHHFMLHDQVMVQMMPSRRGMLWGTGLCILALTVLAWLLLLTPDQSRKDTVVISHAENSQWQIDQDSRVQFSGSHAGRAFSGHFTRWQANFSFDPANPEAGSLTGRFDTSSATDGVALHDETLPQAEWFDSSNHPYAIFQSSRIYTEGDNRFQVEGTLTIKGNEIIITPLTLTLENDRMHIHGQTRIDRGDADLGMESDPDATYVSRHIDIDIQITATPRQTSH